MDVNAIVAKARLKAEQNTKKKNEKKSKALNSKTPATELLSKETDSAKTVEKGKSTDAAFESAMTKISNTWAKPISDKDITNLYCIFATVKQWNMRHFEFADFMEKNANGEEPKVYKIKDLPVSSCYLKDITDYFSNEVGCLSITKVPNDRGAPSNGYAWDSAKLLNYFYRNSK